MRILVTGATGFVGGEVVRRLRGRAELSVLVRGRAGVPAAARAAHLGDVHVVEGEVGGALGDVGGHDVVLHCAGDTTFFPKDLAAYRLGHVDGAVALLRAARPRTFLHVSTAFVCGTRHGVAREDEARLGQHFHNPYEEHKLLAEEALDAAARALGVDLRVARPSIVVGDAPATVGGGPSEKVYGFIRLMRELAWTGGGTREQVRIAGIKRAPFNMVPVDYVADALAALALTPEAAGGTFHLVAEAPAQEELFGVIAERAGLPGLRVVERRARLRDPSAIEAAIDAGLGRYRDYLRHDVVFDDARARTVLAAIPRPSLTGRGLVRFVDQALER